MPSVLWIPLSDPCQRDRLPSVLTSHDGCHGRDSRSLRGHQLRTLPLSSRLFRRWLLPGSARPHHPGTPRHANARRQIKAQRTHRSRGPISISRLIYPASSVWTNVRVKEENSKPRKHALRRVRGCNATYCSRVVTSAQIFRSHYKHDARVARQNCTPHR